MLSVACLPVIEHLCDTIIAEAIVKQAKQWYDHYTMLPEYKSVETVARLLKRTLQFSAFHTYMFDVFFSNMDGDFLTFTY